MEAAVNDTSKLLLTVAVGGMLLGAGLSRYASPTMNQASAADWRERYRPSYSETSMQYVDAGPVDLTPSLAWPGAPFGLHQPMMQMPADFGPYYGTGYTDTRISMPEDDEDSARYPSYETETSAPPVEQALQAAIVAATTLDQATGERSLDSAPHSNPMALPDGSGSVGTPSNSSFPATS